jgi:hypothetical protein
MNEELNKLVTDALEKTGGAAYQAMLWVVDQAPGLPIAFLIASLEWLKILIAPKLWLVEYVASLVR